MAELQLCVSLVTLKALQLIHHFAEHDGELRTRVVIGEGCKILQNRFERCCIDSELKMSGRCYAVRNKGRWKYWKEVVG